jgi:hypothetical protein
LARIKENVMNRNRLGWIVVLALVVGGCSENTGSGSPGQTTVRGEHGEKLTIDKPKYQDIERGGTETVTLNLKRQNFSDSVSVSVSDLPQGVEAVDAPRSTTGEQVEIVLRARDNADLVSNHQVSVSAEGPDGIGATETFQLTVKARR